MKEEQIYMNIERFNIIGGCGVCMSRGRKMFYSERINDCFALLAEFYIPKGIFVEVCWECNAHIENIFKFKSTVERSFKILSDRSMNFEDFDALPEFEHRLQAVTHQLVEVNKLDANQKEENLVTIPCEINSDFDSELGFDEDNNEMLGSFSSKTPTTNEQTMKDCEVCLVPLEQMCSVKLEPNPGQFSDRDEDPLLESEDSSGIRDDECNDESDNMPVLKSLLVNDMQTISAEENFFCTFCSYKCKNKNELNNHKKTHTDKRPFGYEISSLKSDLIGTQDKLLYCNICSYETHERHDFIRHKKRHTDGTLFACDVCEFKCEQRAFLNLHMKKHASNERQFICDVCSYKCNRKRYIRRHMRTHTGACKICSYKCFERSHLERHMMTHTGEKPLACDVCSYRCIRRGTLIRHMKRHGEKKEKKLLHCYICPRKFKQEKRFYVHLDSHRGEKPLYACRICPSKFKLKYYLTRHMRSHTVERPFSCDRHMATDTEEKPFACDICPSKFKLKAHLNVHSNIHTGENPHACDICPYKCTEKRFLIDHMLNHFK